MKELFKPIPGYSKNMAGTYGTILNRQGDIKQPYIDKDGYYRVRLKDENGKFKSLLVSRLVAITWIPNPDNKPEVDHINRNKLKNEITNLRWSTSSENLKNRTCYKPVIATDIQTGEEIEFKSVTDASRKTGIYRQSINKVLRNNTTKYQSAGGFRWRYKEE